MPQKLEEPDELKAELDEAKRHWAENHEPNESSDKEYEQLRAAIEKANASLEENHARNQEIVEKFLAVEARVVEAKVAIARNEEAAKESSEQAHAQIAEVKSSIERVETFARAAGEGVAKVKKELLAMRQQLGEELQAGLRRLEEQFQEELARGLETLGGEVRAEAEAAAQKGERGLRAEADSWRREADELRRQLRATEESQKAQQALQTELELRCGGAEQAAQASSERADAQDARMEEFQNSIDAFTKELELADGRQRELVRDTAMVISSDMEQKLLKAQADNRARMMQLQGVCAAASSAQTQQVEWRIEDCLRQLSPPEEEPESFEEHADLPEEKIWLSPTFEAAGTGGFRLELCARRKRRGIDASDDAAERECSVSLHGPSGLHLEFRVFIGQESANLSHTFDDGSPCSAGRMGSLREHVRKDGSLRLGIEILKASMDVEAPSPEGEQLAGTLVSKHCLNHKLLELLDSRTKDMMDTVHRKLDAARSRAVRRVQWRVEQGSVLLERFPQGQAVCSAPFQAGGISGLQLVFYPTGCKGAKEGFCSFFLVCPPGVTIRCWLWAGRWKREARIEPTGKQDLLGRVNFCRFQNCVDPASEIVELALEIEEAQQQAALEDPKEPCEAPPAGAEALSSPSRRRQDTDVDRVDVGTQKVQPNRGKVIPEQTMTLPSIWTSHGFQTFEELSVDGSRATTARTPRQQPSDASRPTTAAGPGAHSVHDDPRRTPRLHAREASEPKGTARKGLRPQGLQSSCKCKESSPQPSTHGGLEKYKEYVRGL